MSINSLTSYQPLTINGLDSFNVNGNAFDPTNYVSKIDTNLQTLAGSLDLQTNTIYTNATATLGNQVTNKSYVDGAIALNTSGLQTQINTLNTTLTFNVSNLQNQITTNLTYTDTNFVNKTTLTPQQMNAQLIVPSLNLTAQNASKIPIIDASKNLVSSGVDAIKITYLDNVSSDIQTQLNSKASTTYVDTQDNLRVLKSGDTMTGLLTVPSFNVNTATPSTVTIFDASKNVTSSSITTTELTYLSGVTSNIQTQLNNKASTSYIDTNFLNKVTGTAQTITPYVTFNAGFSSISQSRMNELMLTTFDGTLGWGLTVSGSSSTAPYDLTLNNAQTSNNIIFRDTGRIEASFKDPSVTASRVAVFDASKNITNSSVSTTELGYLLGASNNIQLQINDKVDKVGDTMSGDLNMQTNYVLMTANPTLDNQGANKKYVDQRDNLLVPYTGANSLVNLGAQKIQSSTAPTTGNDLCNKTYVDTVAGGSSILSTTNAWTSPNFFTAGLGTAIYFVLDPALPTFQRNSGAVPLWVSVAFLPPGAVNFLTPGTVFTATEVTGQTAFNQTWTVDSVTSSTSIRTTSAQGTSFPAQGFGGVITIGNFASARLGATTIKGNATIDGTLAMGTNKITSSYVPINGVDMCNKTYVDSLINLGNNNTWTGTNTFQNDVNIWYGASSVTKIDQGQGVNSFTAVSGTLAGTTLTFSGAVGTMRLTSYTFSDPNRRFGFSMTIRGSVNTTFIIEQNGVPISYGTYAIGTSYTTINGAFTPSGGSLYTVLFKFSSLTPGSNVDWTAFSLSLIDVNIPVLTTTSISCADSVDAVGLVKARSHIVNLATISYTNSSDKGKWFRVATIPARTVCEFGIGWSVPGEHGYIKVTAGQQFNSSPYIRLDDSSYYGNCIVFEVRLAINSSNIYGDAYLEILLVDTTWYWTPIPVSVWAINQPPVNSLVSLTTTKTAGTTTGYTYYGIRSYFAMDYNYAGYRFCFSSFGTVGIGTDLPLYNLDVTGIARITSSLYLTNGALVIGDGGAYTEGCIYSDANWGMLFRAKQASNVAQFEWRDYNGYEVMRIDSNKRLGVNTGNSSLVDNLQVFSNVDFDAKNSVNFQCQASQYGRNHLYMTGRFELNNDAWSFASGRNNIIFRTQSSLNSAYTNRWAIQNWGENLGFLCAGRGDTPVMVMANNGAVTVQNAITDYTNSFSVSTPWSSIRLDGAYTGRSWSILNGGSGAGIGQGNLGIFDITRSSYTFAIDSVGRVGIGNFSAVIGKLQMVDSGNGTWNTSDWHSGQSFIISQDTTGSTRSSALAFSHTSSNYSWIVSLQPAVAWRDVIFAAGAIYFVYFGTTVAYTAGGGIVNISDEREKEDIQDLKTSSSLRRVLCLKPKHYRRKYPECKVEMDENGEQVNKSTPVPDEIRNKRCVGFLAQDLCKSNPHCVSEWEHKECKTEDDDGKRLGVNYNDYIVHLVGAVQEQQKQIETLQNNISVLVEHSRQQEKRDKEQDQEIKTLTALLQEERQKRLDFEALTEERFNKLVSLLIPSQT